MDQVSVPEGFIRHFRRSPLTEPWEPLYSRRTEKAVILGFRAAENHTNARGFVHGGLITALADNAMGLSCTLVLRGETAGLLTISLAVDFLSVARTGQWIEIDTTFTRPGSIICFAQAFITADGATCGRANATFRVLQAKGAA
jgi:uncharacterized protein (TIGR00369 family)